MNKPIFKNWIKYGAGTFAVSGLLLMGACGNNEEAATEDELLPPTELEAPEREEVSVVAEEEEEVVVVEETVAEEEAPIREPRFAYTIRNMDAHLEQHEDVNRAIKEELTDYDPNLAVEGQSSLDLNQEANQDMGLNAPDLETEEEAAKVDITRESNPETPASVYERHIVLYSKDLSGYAKQRLDEIMGDYFERREQMRGQIDPATGIYIAPDIDPEPTIGYEAFRYQINEHVDYPRDAEAIGVEGIVLVNVVVDESGEIIEVDGLDEVITLEEKEYPLSFTEEDIIEAKADMVVEAARALEETEGLWKAGTVNGERVKSAVLIPVEFEVRELGVGEDEILGPVDKPVDVLDN